MRLWAFAPAAAFLLMMACPALAAVRVETEDRDKDGRIDTWKHYTGKKLVITERDTNGDGKPDTATRFLKGRELILKTSDTDHDGKIDKRMLSQWKNDRKQIIGVRNGQPQYLMVPGYEAVWTETDTDHDGLIDIYKERGKAKPDRDRIGKSIEDEVTV